jgi:hypothetical protein
LSLGLLQLLSHSAAGAAALLRLPPAEGLGLLVPLLALREPGDGCSGGGRGCSAAGASATADARQGVQGGAVSEDEVRLTVVAEALTVIRNVFRHVARLGQQRLRSGGAGAAPPGASRSASDRPPPEFGGGDDPTRASAVVAALMGPLIEVAAGRGAAAGFRSKDIWVLASCALEALERSMWVVFAAAEVAYMASGPAAGAGVEEREPLALFLHPGSAATLTAMLRGALEAATRSGDRDGNSGVAVSEAAGLLFAAAMAPPGQERTQWCREAVAAELPSLLLRAAVQLSTQLDDPAAAARAASAACVMAYAADNECLAVDTQDERREWAPGGEPLSGTRAAALSALVACAGSSCSEAAMQAAAGALHTCQESSGCAADLAAHPGAATALVGALLRCAAAARAAGLGGSYGSMRMAGGTGAAGLLLSMVAAAACEDDAEATAAAKRQSRCVDATVGGNENDNIEESHAAAEAALLRLVAAGGQGGLLAADAEAALGFLRRREAPPPLAGPGALVLTDGRRCLACGKGRGGGVTLRRCSGCMAEGVYYCSVEW